jgi:hypothetical protein
MIKLTWSGQYGQAYAFEVFPAGTRFNPLSGLYVFCGQKSDGMWYVQYAGETEDFEARLSNCRTTHHAWPLAAGHGSTHVGVLVMNGPRSNRLQAETDLRHSLRPPANRQPA